MDALEAAPPYVLGVKLISTWQKAADRARSAPPWIFDSVLAAVFLVSALTSTSGASANGLDYDPRDVYAYGLILLATAPLCLRRRAPLLVVAVTTVTVAVYVLAGFNEGTLPLVVLVGAYTLGAYCPARQAIAGASLIAGVLLLLLVGHAHGFGVDDALGNAAFFAASGALGWSVQSRRLRLEALEQRADALQREQDEEARRAVADERLRIAQELHDVVAHSMSIIAVQAGAGMHVVDRDPDEAKKALENISATSRSTLTELRRLLGVLREGEEGAAYAPAPGLADLDRLVGEVADAGLPVAVDLDGDLSTVPPGVDFTAYRVVQEALTNVLKHAGPAEASVRVTNDSGRLSIEVTDDGRGVNGRAGSAGHGLMGMRERVAVYGGTLDVGPRSGGGFRVAAELPYGSNDVVAGS
jgi:signal transduction histidine kinase